MSAAGETGAAGELVVDHVFHHYFSAGRRVDVLNDVSFRVPAASVACVVGPSGCGKSTLLGLAAGLLRPAGGSLTWDGAPVRIGPNHDLGMAFQMQDDLLEQLVVDRVIKQRLRERQFAVGDAAVRKIAREEPAFQLNGKYDANVAKAALAQYGMTESAYFSDTRLSLLRAQLQRGIRQSNFLTNRELERL